MAWYIYIAHFIAGLFLANSIPHFVNGISGRAFISPFGNPPGRGESSAVSNVLWGGANMVIGFGFLWFWPLAMSDALDVIVFAGGFFLTAVGLARTFSQSRVERM